MEDVVVKGSDVVVKLPAQSCGFSTTIDGGYRCGLRYVIMHHVSRYFTDPYDEAYEALRNFNVNKEEALVFLTALEPSKSLKAIKGSDGELSISIYATVGLSYGYVIEDGVIKVDDGSHRAGTVNILSIVYANVGSQTLLDALRMLIEAKASALAKYYGIMGTASDAYAVVCPCVGPYEQYSGPSTRLGRLMVKLVYEALKPG